MPERSTFEQELAKNGKLIYYNVGDSMLPLIRQGRDLLEIVPKPAGRLHRYDVPLYRRSSGQYVLHRILKVRPQDYVLCGDNRWTREYGVTDGQIIGVLHSVIRDGKPFSVECPKYRLYVHRWCDCFPVRAFLLRLRRKLKRMRKPQHEK